MWEKIDGTSASYTERTPVYRGWIVKTSHAGIAVTLVFIPDPNHEWKVSCLKDESE